MVGVPANVLSYYSADTSMQMSMSGIPTSADVMKYFKGDFNSAFSASGSAQVMAYAFDSVFEFVSADGSGQYKNGDQKVNTVKYTDVKWNAMTVDVQDKHTNITATSFSSDKETNGISTFSWITGSEYSSISNGNGAVLTPNSTKVDFTFQFPSSWFKVTTNYLAVQMVIASASASGATDAQVELKREQVTSGNTYISWVGKADTKLGLIDVTAVAGADAGVGYFDSSKSILSSMKAIAQVGGTADVKLKVVNFCFPANANHGYIYWDPAGIA